MAENKCGALLPQLEGHLVCDEPAGHDEPTAESPHDGSPHQDSTALDILTGEPRRWWS